MPSTLTSLRDRVAAALMDSANLSWDSAALDEAIRQALAFITKARTPPAAFTISGLDGAASTTLSEDDGAYLVLGASGFAARSRAVSRSQAANLEQSMPNALLNWSSAQLEAFFFGLGLKSSASPASGGDALEIAQLQIDAAAAAVAAANTRADSQASAEAARKTGLQTSNSSPHQSLAWAEPKNW